MPLGPSTCCARPHRLAGKEARAADAVAADVHERAAVERRVEPHVSGADRERERCAHEPKLADGAAAHELEQALRLGMVAPHEGLHEQAPGAVGGVEGALDVGGTAASGFSHSTCFPASSARTDQSTCGPFGSEM